MNKLQLVVLVQALEIEIKTWDGHKMKLTREPALHAVKRLTGNDFGRGLSARKNALAWLQAVADENGIELRKR
jgi:hypothetical protein